MGTFKIVIWSGGLAVGLISGGPVGFAVAWFTLWMFIGT